MLFLNDFRTSNLLEICLRYQQKAQTMAASPHIKASTFSLVVTITTIGSLEVSLRGMGMMSRS